MTRLNAFESSQKNRRVTMKFTAIIAVFAASAYAQTSSNSTTTATTMTVVSTTTASSATTTNPVSGAREIAPSSFLAIALAAVAFLA